MQHSLLTVVTVIRRNLDDAALRHMQVMRLADSFGDHGEYRVVDEDGRQFRPGKVELLETCLLANCLPFG